MSINPKISVEFESIDHTAPKVTNHTHGVKDNKFYIVLADGSTRNISKINGKDLNASTLSEAQMHQIKNILGMCRPIFLDALNIPYTNVTRIIKGEKCTVDINTMDINQKTVIGLACLYLIGYFVAKGIDHQFIASSLLYLVPHVIIVILSIWILKRVTKGIE